MERSKHQCQTRVNDDDYYIAALGIVLDVTMIENSSHLDCF